MPSMIYVLAVPLVMPKPDPLQAGSSFSFKLVGVGVTTVTGGGTTAATGAAITGTGTTTAAGFSAAGGAGIIGKEAKKSGEFSVANEKVAQLEIDVGQIERVVEEEQKTPEGDESDESLDEGDESDESLDEIDERLLQHAMNSDLLNDDDRRHFRGSITIIQRRASIAAS